MNIENEYHDQTFDAIDVESQSLHGAEYSACVFRNCKLDEVDLSRCAFEDCEFIGCSLIACKLNNSRFQNVAFHECKLVGMDFSALNDFLIGFSMHHSILMSCTFSDLNIPATMFESCQIRDSTFTNCNLKKAGFSATVFDAGGFVNCDLTGADFVAATGFQIDPNANRLRDAAFSRESAVELLNGYALRLV